MTSGGVAVGHGRITITVLYHDILIVSSIILVIVSTTISYYYHVYHTIIYDYIS